MNRADIYDNPDNWNSKQLYDRLIARSSAKRKRITLFSLSGAQKMEFSFPDIEDNYNIRNNTWTLSIYKKVGNVYNLATVIGPSVDPDPDFPVHHVRNLDAGEYYTTFQVISNTSYVNYGQVKIAAEFRDKKA